MSRKHPRSDKRRRRQIEPGMWFVLAISAIFVLSFVAVVLWVP